METTAARACGKTLALRPCPQCSWGPRCEPAFSWEQRAGLGQRCSTAPARGPQPSPRHQPLPLWGRSSRSPQSDPYKGLRRPLGSPQLPSTCSELKRIGCPADSPAPSGAPLTTGCSQLLWAGATHEPRLPLHLGDTPACQWGLGLPARRGPPDAASVAGRSRCHHPLQCTLCPQPGGCLLPSHAGPLEARVCLLPPSQTSGLGAWCRETWARPGCLHLSHNARFHSGPRALVHGGASCPPLPLENQRIQLEEFSGVLPHPPSPPSDGAGPVGGYSEGTPHPIGTL